MFLNHLKLLPQAVLRNIKINNVIELSKVDLLCSYYVFSVFILQCLSSYMEQFVGTESSLCSQAEGYFFKPVFLPRYDGLTRQRHFYFYTLNSTMQI